MVASNNPKIKASSKYLRMSPTKVRRVLTQLVGKSYEEALILLEYMPYRSCGPISKLLCSAAANAFHNNGISVDDLVITKALVDKGPVLKRFRPRSQGRAFKILKPTCHLTIELEAL
jgi:large subunit ribosomal protein L22